MKDIQYAIIKQPEKGIVDITNAPTIKYTPFDFGTDSFNIHVYDKTYINPFNNADINYKKNNLFNFYPQSATSGEFTVTHSSSNFGKHQKLSLIKFQMTDGLILVDGLKVEFILVLQV